MIELSINSLEVSFDSWKLGPIDIYAKKGSFISIVGPSGSGKTSLLKAISGLENAKGSILFGALDVSELPAEKRGVGFVFQGNSLFTHLNVFENVAFGLRVKGLKDVVKEVSEALLTVNLKKFENRKITGLSGGEMKRVCIARALASKPKLLLLDEPMNGLDAPLKEKMKTFLKQLRKKTGITTIMVTHDLDEAFYLSDKIVVMNNGKVEQESAPVDLFMSPKNDFVKNFVSDYILVKANNKKSGGIVSAEGKICLPAKEGKGKVFLVFKKTNYRYFE